MSLQFWYVYWKGWSFEDLGFGVAATSRAAEIVFGSWVLWLTFAFESGEKGLRWLNEDDRHTCRVEVEETALGNCRKSLPSLPSRRRPELAGRTFGLDLLDRWSGC